MAKEYAYDYSYYTGSRTGALPYREEQTRERAVPKARPKVKKKNRLNALLSVVLAVMVFAVVYRYAIINEMKSNNVALNKMLTEATVKTDLAKIELQRTTDLNYVERMAKEKLGMDFPQKHQIINVTLEQEDKVVKATPEKKGFFAAVGDFFGGIVEYMY